MYKDNDERERVVFHIYNYIPEMNVYFNHSNLAIKFIIIVVFFRFSDLANIVFQ